MKAPVSEKRFDEVKSYSVAELKQLRLARLEKSCVEYQEYLAILRGNIKTIRNLEDLSETALIESLEFMD